MTHPRDLKKLPYTAGEFMRREIASDVYGSLLTRGQRSLLRRIDKTAVLDTQRNTLTFILPPNAKEADLKAVLPVYDLLMVPDMKILVAREIPRDHNLVERVDKEALRRYARKNKMLDSRSVKRMLGEEDPAVAERRARIAEADKINKAVYSKLRTHFRKAAAKHPQYADTFKAELDTYKKVLIDRDSASMLDLANKFSMLMGEPVNPPQVERVTKGALEIYANKPRVLRNSP